MKKQTGIILASAIAAVMVAPASFADSHGGGKKNGWQGQHMQDMFNQIDANDDGKLTEEEINAHRDSRFAEADSNGDGAIDSEEMKAHMLSHFQERIDERVSRMFEKMDKDEDGRISPEEHGQMGRGEGKGKKSMLERLDENDDGVVTLEEFTERGSFGKGRKGKGGKYRHGD